jgi:hypothetical protein
MAGPLESMLNEQAGKIEPTRTRLGRLPSEAWMGSGIEHDGELVTLEQRVLDHLFVRLCYWR